MKLAIISTALLLAIFASAAQATCIPGTQLQRICGGLGGNEACRTACGRSPYNCPIRTSGCIPSFQSEVCCCSCPRAVNYYPVESGFRGRRSISDNTNTSSYPVSEGIGSQRFCGVATFTELNETNITIVVTIGSQPDTATTSDYDPSMVPKQMVFTLSNDEDCFDVPIIDDDEREDTENFMFTFDPPTDPDIEVIVTPRILNVEIIDNDGGSSAGIVHAGRLIFFVTVLGWILTYALHV